MSRLHVRSPILALAAAMTAAGAVVAAEDRAPLPERWSCRGNEPFWNLEIDGDDARYDELGAAAPIELAGQATALDFLPKRQLVWRGRGGASTRDIVALITEEPCLDTMSDREGRTRFPYSVRVSMPDGDVLVGCCRPRPARASADSGSRSPISPADRRTTGHVSR